MLVISLDFVQLSKRDFNCKLLVSSKIVSNYGFIDYDGFKAVQTIWMVSLKPQCSM